MSCITLKLPPMMMGTAACISSPCREICLPLREEPTTECTTLRAHWVMVADKNGTSQLRMQWQVHGDESSEAVAQKSPCRRNAPS